MTNDFFNPGIWAFTLAQLLIAMVCGGIIGYQREKQESAAGFRTHILVCVGSAIFMLVSVSVAGPTYDPGRIAAQVASGIGFLGAGTIIKQGSIVRGLTTAASLWAVAAIGLAIGYGGKTLVIAILGTLVVFISLSLLKVIENYMARAHNCYVTFAVTEPNKQIDRIRKLLAANNIDVHSLEIHQGEEGQEEIAFEGRVFNREDLDHAISQIARTSAIRNVRWEYR